MNQEVLKSFADGVAAWEGGNLTDAKANFDWCTHLDPSAHDAIRAQVALDVNAATRDDIDRLWETRSSYGHLMSAIRRPIETINGRFNPNLWGLEFKLATRSDLVLAHATTLMNDGDWVGADKALDGANQELPTTSLFRAVLNFRTKRWGDVIRICDPLSAANEYHYTDKLVEPITPDNVVRQLSALMAGEALIRLERPAAAVEKLSEAFYSKDPNVASHAAFLTALAQRAEGDENGAKESFDKALSRVSDPEIIKAAGNQNYRLETTSEDMIAQRTDPWNAATEPSLAQTRAEEVEESRGDLVAEAKEELASYIGMDSVKAQVRTLEAKTTAARVRAERGLNTEAVNQHLIFTGPPGTGKTTIARVVAKMYAGLGVTRENKVLETGRADFVGQTVGSTAMKTNKLIDQALGGILFIDEAYALVQDTGTAAQKDAFGQEAIDTLVARMENDRKDLVVIIAGYNRDIERLLATNDGLKSRFSRKIEFHTYSADEIWLIFQQMAESRGDIVSDGVEDIIKEQVRDVLMTRNHDGKTLLDLAGNGRFVRNIIEGSEEARDLRVMDEADARGVTLDQLSNDDLMTVTPADVLVTIEKRIAEYL